MYRYNKPMKENKISKSPYDSDPVLNIWKRKNSVLDIRHLARTFKFAFQRSSRGFSQEDAQNIDTYLQHLIPNMLQYLRDNHSGSPVFTNQEDCHEDCHKEWDMILDKMISLWRESVEETCSRKNKYEDEYEKVLEDFEKKYGMLGEKILTEDDVARIKAGKGRRVYTINDMPEYADFCRRYSEEAKLIKAYRKKCKDEAMDMLKKYFYHLWD